jgi:hypothetical protein
MRAFSLRRGSGSRYLAPHFQETISMHINTGPDTAPYRRPAGWVAIEPYTAEVPPMPAPKRSRTGFAVAMGIVVAMCGIAAISDGSRLVPVATTHEAHQ